MGCFALYPPLVLTFLFLLPTFIHLLSLVFLLFYFSIALVKREALRFC